MTLLVIICQLALFALAFGAAMEGTIQGTVIDDKGQPIPFANITIEQAGQVVTGATTNFDGVYKVKALRPGEYLVTAGSVGYQSEARSGVRVSAEQITTVDFTLKYGIKLQEVVVQSYKVPIIERDGGSSLTVTAEEFRRLPSRSIGSTVTLQAGVQEDDNGGIGSIRGARDNGNSSFIYVDGVKVRNSTAVTQAGTEEVKVLAGGIPARYGDASGGIISISNSPDVFAGHAGTNRSRAEKKKARKLDAELKRRKKKGSDEGSKAGYDPYHQQSFKNVFSEPLSTFSIDVDAASYSQVRRSLNNGYIPNVDIVRIEEMINYFSYEYPQPTDDSPFSISQELTVCPWNPAHRLAMIGLQGKDLEMEVRPENNLVFLIDVSGSMQSFDKLELLKKSLRLLVDELEETDKISIVVYAGAAGLVLKSTRGDEKGEILEAINRLSAGGSTAGGAGIQLAYKQAEKEFLKEGNNRVILCTDGDFNVGVYSEGGLEKLIEKKRETGVFLTVLGFGTGNFQDSKMETLADKGNGNFAYIDNLQEAQKVLVSEFWGTMFTIAKDVKIQIEFNPRNVVAYRLIGYENRRLAAEDFNDDKKDAGELGAGHTVTALYEIIPVGVESGFAGARSVDSLKYQLTTPKLAKGTDGELLTVKLRYKEPDEDESKLLSVSLLDEPKVLEESSQDIKFSSAVAHFGMVLLDTQLKPEDRMGELQKVVDLAVEGKGDDDEGRRAEFIRLAELAMVAD